MRFATAADLQDALPSIKLGYSSPLPDMSSANYVASLVSGGKLADAVAFVAHLLPRREAVWWAAQCVRREPNAFSAQEEQLLAAAEAWARNPSDELRRKVLALTDKMPQDRPAGWVARAAGWSGGPIIEVDAHRVMAEPQMCPAAARAAVLTAASAASDPLAFMTRCVEDAMALINRT
jgi:hypothetical protein